MSFLNTDLRSLLVWTGEFEGRKRGMFRFYTWKYWRFFTEENHNYWLQTLISRIIHFDGVYIYILSALTKKYKKDGNEKLFMNLEYILQSPIYFPISSTDFKVYGSSWWNFFVKPWKLGKDNRPVNKTYRNSHLKAK